MNASRTTAPPKIDGELNDEAWATAEAATGFVQYQPYNGKAASLPTEVKIVYDDYAFYVGALLYDPQPDSIYTELSVRDEINIADYFGVYFDPFNDFITAYGFIVTAAGVQVDLKSVEGSGEDESWNAVWKSEIKITDTGWVAELEIPHSALRFPKTGREQVWGLQFFRQIMRYRETDTWNFIDRNADGLNNQAGRLTGIHDLDPPLRLSVVPYLSGYVEKNPELDHWSAFSNYGLDLKYGISESFTLDMTLVPDFGQVQSDDIIYNLSPFEVYYDEKRPFFMEGTELFDRGNVFYSRRIGATPSGYDATEDSLLPNEIIIDNPLSSQLINATKISGKTKKGLGIGLFNAMTSNTFAEIQDTLTGASRKVTTEPFSNYNMIVIDRSLRNNSFVSAYNTNVYKPENEYSANVSGTEFKITDKKNTYSVFGIGSVSQHYDKGEKPGFGHKYLLSAGKISGRFIYELEHSAASDTYDPNEMGYLSKNNEFENLLYLAYNQYEPHGKLLEWTNELEISWDFLYHPRKFTWFSIDYDTRATNKNHLTVWFNSELKPVNSYDYYEPRVWGYYYTAPPSLSMMAGYSPDYRKKFLIDLRAGYFYSGHYREEKYSFNISPRFRAGDKLMIIHRFDYSYNRDDMGYVTDTTGNDGAQAIIFGRRNLELFTNTLTAEYKFTPRSALSLRIRHYWITGKYLEFYDLLTDGYLKSNQYRQGDDFSYNAFNIDLFYQWNFAPGSEINLVWKNSIHHLDETPVFPDGFSSKADIPANFIDNFRNTINTPSANSFSVKILYYLDYMYLKKLHKKPSES
ncbi:MAG: carbohydrate binding family 9 domain-containing protein [Bacteroidales bacterium]|nr:carbohydrate binding family 9 domain-containing protein [Bacteroidales bacterium]